MKTIEATYRITTPMFCSGADQTRAELRLPSFKGVLRFWWRALNFEKLGGSIEEVHRREAAIFGSATQGQSRFLFHVNPPTLPAEAIADQQHFSPSTWEGYVGYGLTDKDKRPIRQFIRAGTEFRVTAIGPRAGANDWAALRTSLIALGTLGGFGGRSRKGWGSLTLQRLDEEGKDPWMRPASREEVCEVTRGFVPKMQENAYLRPITSFTPGARIAVGPAHDDARRAHRWLAEQYKNGVRSAAPESKEEREQFGLPRAGAGRNAYRRRASPVFLHVHQAEGAAAIPIVTFLPAKFLEAQDQPCGGWDRVRSFLDVVEAG